MSSEFTKEADEKSKALLIEPLWRPIFALYDGEDLVCVTVYKKGALEVKRRLEAAQNLIQKQTE